VRAVRIHEDGGPEVLRYEEAPEPTAGPGEVLIALRAASLNHLDIWIRKGLPSVAKPRITGADGAGVVAALGEAAGAPGAGGDGATLTIGQRVVIDPSIVVAGGGIQVPGESFDGTHAQLVAIPARNVHPLPDHVSFESAAAFPLVFVTAHRMLVTRARLRPGETVFIWGIGSGVSSAALAIARALGARTIVTSSSPEKLARARELGADATIDHVHEDVRARVRELTGGQGCEIVVDHVGADTWKTTVEIAARDGRIVVCGATSGPNPPAALHRLWWKELSVYGSTMGDAADFTACLDLVASGRALPVLDRSYPLEQVRAAHERLEAGAQLGKIVLTVPQF
jgi:NADPH:quinone reductase-like Zn-dependent oxidoreductase